MDVWFNLTRFTLVLYFTFLSIKYKSGNLITLIIALLVLLCLNLCIYLIKSKNFKIILAVIGIIFTILLGRVIFNGFYFFLPLQILEACYLVDYKNNYLQFSMMLLLFLSSEISYREMFIVSLLILIIYNCCNYYNSNLILYKTKYDELWMENSKTLKTSLENQSFKDQAVYLGQLEERNKIAQEIHDKIGHTISGSIMQLEAAKLLMDKEPDKSKNMISNSVDVLRQGLESIRETLRRIKPQRELLGLNKLKLILEDFKKSSSIYTYFIFKGDIDNINAEAWRVLIQNLTEALTNSAKYSNCSKVTVTLEVLNKLIKMEVKDNGTGSNNIIKGMGLRGMEERTVELHGKLILDGSNGFDVITLLPIN